MEHRVTEPQRAIKDAKGKSHSSAFVGIFEVLEREHAEVAELLDRLCLASHPKLRAELWPQVRHALLSHDQGEVRVLSPDLHELATTRALAQRHDVEARDLESMIRRLEGRDYDDPEWHASALTLRQWALRHIKEEEAVFLPRAQQVLGAKRAEELKHAYYLEKAGGGSRSTRGNGPLGGTP